MTYTRLVLLAIVLLACLCATASEAQPTSLRVSAAAAQLGDVASTQWALRQPGTREANPLALAGQPAAQVAVKVGAILLVDLAARRLHRTGHPTAAKRLLWVVTGTYTAVTLSNLRQGR